MIRKINLFEWLSKKKFKNKEPTDEEIMDTIFDTKCESFSVKLLAVNLAISYIADTFSKCKFQFYENGTKEKYSPKYYLFNIGPNKNMSATILKRNLIFKLFLDGEALIFSEDGSLYLADSFFREEHPLSEDRFTNISIKNETKTFDKDASNVFYFSFEGNGIKHLVDSLYSDYVDLMNYAIKNYETSGSEKYKLKLDHSKVNDPKFMEEYENVIKAQLKTFIENPRAVYPEFKGYSLEKVGESNNHKTDSSDILALKKDAWETISMAFKIPISLLYGNMTNVKDLQNMFFTFALDPVREIIEAEVNKKTYRYSDYEKKNYCAIDKNDIVHTDVFDIADKIDKLISSGFFCIDEAREKVGEEPLNTEFSQQHFMTKNYAIIEEILKTLKGGG